MDAAAMAFVRVLLAAVLLYELLFVDFPADSAIIPHSQVCLGLESFWKIVGPNC